MADGITFDKPSYKPGDKITATIILAARVVVDEVKFTTAVGNLTATTKIVADGTITDSAGKTWNKVSDDGVTAVYTTTA